MTHLDALQLRLSNERIYLAKAKTPAEQELRKVWVSQIEKEIGQEHKFQEVEMTDDELLEALR